MESENPKRDLNEANRSTAPTPAVQAMMNEMIKAAVTEALAGASAQRDALVKAAVDKALADAASSPASSAPSATAGVTQADLAMLVKELALTPEKLEALKRPYEDPAVKRRKLREQLAFKEDEKEMIRQQQQQKNRCSHKHRTGVFAISFVSNFLDKQTRGICMKCGEWFNPAEWQIGAPTEEYPKGKPYLKPRHAKWTDGTMRTAAEQQEAIIIEMGPNG